MRASARVALASIAVSATFSVSGCAAIVASNSRMGIACSWSCCIDGSHRSSKPSRSSGLKLSYVGIEPASVGTGGGNHALLEAARRSMPELRALIRRMSAENPLWGRRALMASCSNSASRSPVQRREVYGEAMGTTIPGMAHLPA
jgi:hypothetical protein